MTRRDPPSIAPATAGDATTKGASRRRRLPPWVQARGRSFRGWAMVDGRRVYGYARQDAMDAHRDAVELRARAAGIASGRWTLRTASDAMHAEVEATRSAGTVDFYRLQAAAVFRYVSEDLDIDELTPELLQVQLVSRARQDGLGCTTLSHYRRWLNRLLVWAARPPRCWTTRPNPVPLVAWPEHDEASIPDVFDEAEIHAILMRLEGDPFAHALVCLFAYTGLRRAEVARLQAADFDFAKRVIWVRGKSRNEALPIVEDLRASCMLLVTRANGGHLVPGETEQKRCDQVTKFFKKWAKQLGDRRFHPHALRHSLATNLVRAKVPTATVQRMLRHSTYATTQRYVHLVADDLRDAAKRLRYVKGDGPELLKGTT